MTSEQSYEEYIAELETKLSESEQSREALKAQVAAQDSEIKRQRDKAGIARSRSSMQDAITAWTMGHE